MKVWLVSSASVEEEKYLELARNIARFFANRKDELVCGGITSSMTKVIYNVYEEFHEKVTCVTLECYNEDLSLVTNPIIVNSTFDRTKKLYEEADVIVFLPGGTGSLTEILASIEEHRTISTTKKLFLFNEGGFYDPLISFIGDLIRLGFNKPSIFEHIDVVENLKELEEKVSE